MLTTDDDSTNALNVDVAYMRIMFLYNYCILVEMMVALITVFL